MILKQLVVGPFASNCYVVGSDSTREAIIIDPGADAKTILKNIASEKLSVALIVATHNHVDHVGALRQVKEETGAPYAVHEDDARSLMPAAFGRMLGVVMGGSLKAAPEPDRLLHDGDEIEIADLKFAVMHTPGHSPGGISLVSNGVVFSGDTLFNLGVGRTDLAGGSYSVLMNSIVKLMALPDDTIVYPGHGPRTTIGFERKRNPFLV